MDRGKVLDHLFDDFSEYLTSRFLQFKEMQMEKANLCNSFIHTTKDIDINLRLQSKAILNKINIPIGENISSAVVVFGDVENGINLANIIWRKNLDPSRSKATEIFKDAVNKESIGGFFFLQLPLWLYIIGKISKAKYSSNPESHQFHHAMISS